MNITRSLHLLNITKTLLLIVLECSVVKKHSLNDECMMFLCHKDQITLSKRSILFTGSTVVHDFERSLPERPKKGLY